MFNGFPNVRGAVRGVLTGLFDRGFTRGMLNDFPIVRGAFRGALTKFV